MILKIHAVFSCSVYIAAVQLASSFVENNSSLDPSVVQRETHTAIERMRASSRPSQLVPIAKALLLMVRAFRMCTLILCPWLAQSTLCSLHVQSSFISLHIEALLPTTRCLFNLYKPSSSPEQTVLECTGEGWQGRAGRGCTRWFCSGTSFSRAEKATENYSEPLGGFSIDYSTSLTCVCRSNITQNLLNATQPSLRYHLLWVLPAERSFLGEAFWLYTDLSLCAGNNRLAWKAYSNKHCILHLETRGGLSTQAKCYVFQLSNKIDLHRSKEEIRHFIRLFPNLCELRNLDLKLLGAQQEEIVQTIYEKRIMAPSGSLSAWENRAKFVCRKAG